MLFDMLEYYRMLKKSNINIIYSGPIWADGVEGIGGTLRKRLELDELPLSASQSVFSVFVEQMNNMLMYSTDQEHYIVAQDKHLDVPSGVFILGAKEKKYFVQSGNMMKNDCVSMMQERIEYLNTLDRTQLRKYYKEQIKLENKNPHSKGAGLGLIEIARRASSKIDYEFTPIDSEFTFFAMCVEIG